MRGDRFEIVSAEEKHEEWETPGGFYMSRNTEGHSGRGNNDRLITVILLWYE